MVLAASSADRSQVELVEPPEGALPGERIQFNEEHILSLFYFIIYFILQNCLNLFLMVCTCWNTGRCN